MERRSDKHIDTEELSALVPSLSGTEENLPSLSADAIREAERHIRSCVDCGRRVSRYRRLVNLVGEPKEVFVGGDCPEDVDWDEVASGMWPEFRVRQLIAHAAFCDYCGPLLHSATSVDEPNRQEAKLPAPSHPASRNGVARHRARPASVSQLVRRLPSLWPLVRWLAPVAALIVITGALSVKRWESPSLSGPKFAEFAAGIHQQHSEGDLALEVHSDSQQALNDWFKTRLQFSLALPASPPIPGEQRPYRLEGARVVQVAGKTAAYIAYRTEDGPASLMVTPDSVALASGGIEVNFKKVTFHYATVRGHKVVTWSQHGLTYALVSQEGNATQRSCMVCHSAMRDRDLSHIPTPLLRPNTKFTESILQ